MLVGTIGNKFVVFEIIPDGDRWTVRASDGSELIGNAPTEAAAREAVSYIEGFSRWF